MGCALKLRYWRVMVTRWVGAIRCRGNSLEIILEQNLEIRLVPLTLLWFELPIHWIHKVRSLTKKSNLKSLITMP